MIEDFMKYKEYPVGGYFKINNEVFKVVESNYDQTHDHPYQCEYCDMSDTECDFLNCVKSMRKDKLDIFATLYDTLEDEDETSNV